MLSIGTYAYQNAANLLTNDNSLIRQMSATNAGTATPPLSDSTSTAPSGDRVTLSPEGDAARLRESLGLNPTGKLKRQDFEALIQSDKEGVRQTLQANINALAPGASGSIDTLALSMDAKGNIQVAGDWSGKDALAKNLNADADFKKMFTRLSTNSGLMNYADQIANKWKGGSLSDYLDADSDTADNNLTTLLQQYSALKSSKNSLAGLISISSRETPPFTLTYKNGATSGS